MKPLKELSHEEYLDMISNGDYEIANQSEALHLIDSGLSFYLKQNEACSKKEVECPECRKVLPNVERLYFHMADQHTRDQWIQVFGKQFSGGKSQFLLPFCYPL